MPSSKPPLRPRFGGVLFNGVPPRANRLQLRYVDDSAAQSGIHFDIDGRCEGEIRVNWQGLRAEPTDCEVKALWSALGALVIQHALPRRVEDLPSLQEPAARSLRDLLGMLYDIRAFCDESPFRRAPGPPVASGTSRRPSGGLDPRRVLILLSGGFDSTMAAILLKEAGLDVVGLHIRSNRHVEVVEAAAARSVAEWMGIPLHEVGLDFPQQEPIGRYYSRSFGEYPFYNSVPHGRDFALAVIASMVARRLGCGSVAFGHEKESRSKSFEHDGRIIHRHDVESRYGFGLATAFVEQAMSSDVRLFSPVAGWSIYRIRRTIFEHYPDVAPVIQSCFWGRRCEKCLKCLSAYTMQRHLGIDSIPFTTNPFADRDDRDMALFASPDRPTERLAYGPQMHYAMALIVASGRQLAADWWLDRFREDALPLVERHWDRIERLCLDIDPAEEAPLAVRRALESQVWA